MKNLAKAVVETMKQIKGVEKNAKVGSGSYGYKGVNDQEVKLVIGQAMRDNGLCLIPTDIIPVMNLDRYEENNRRKTNVFTEVRTKYLLMHESGEQLEVAGYGHGSDTMDKSAGKATTYALKYCLLYMFLVPTGDIDDTDASHSEDLKTPPKKKLTVERYKEALKFKPEKIKTVVENYDLTQDQKKGLLDQYKKATQDE